MMHLYSTDKNINIRRNAIIEVADRIETILSDLVPNICKRVVKNERTTILEEDVIQEMSMAGYHL